MSDDGASGRSGAQAYLDTLEQFNPSPELQTIIRKLRAELDAEEGALVSDDDYAPWRAAGVNPPTPRKENPVTRDAVRRALRTFIITTLALFIPGLLGWLNDLTQWAAGNGERPFPDGHGLLFLLVSACVAGLVAVVNLAWNVIEDATGKGMLRTVPAKHRGEAGESSYQVAIRTIGLVAVIVAVGVIVVALIR